MKRSWLGGVLVALALVLGGCATPGATPTATAMACDQVAAQLESAQAELESLAGTPGEAGAQSTLDALNERVEECKVEATATPSPSATPTATESATPQQSSAAPSSSTTASPTPSSTATPSISAYHNWHRLVAATPDGLKETINANEAWLGFNWADAQKWGAQKNSGVYPDARVVLAFQDYPSASAAQKAAGVADNVPVIRVETCTQVSGNGCPAAGAELVLAPIKDDGTVTLKGVGAVVLAEGYPLVADIKGNQLK